MLTSYKTELKLTGEQIHKINQTIGTCRFIYNFYLAKNKEIYESDKKFMSGMDFSKWINNEFIPNNPEYRWIKEVSSKAIKQSIMNGEKAFKRFFDKKSKFPRFKKKTKSDVKAYFPKNNLTDWTVERHRIKIPTLGFIRLKEKRYIPAGAKVKSGTVSKKAGRYYVSVLIEVEDQTTLPQTGEGMGIDLGIKDFAIVNTMDKPFPNINKTKTVKAVEKDLKENKENFRENTKVRRKK